MSEQQHWSQQQKRDNEEYAFLPQLRAELDSLDNNTKCSYAIVQKTSPNQVSDLHLSRFLYAEGYDVKVSAQQKILFIDSAYYHACLLKIMSYLARCEKGSELLETSS